MIVILKKNPDQKQLNNLLDWLSSNGIKAKETIGTSRTILGLVGDTSALDMTLLQALDIVDDVKRIQEPYKKANRKFHPNDTVIKVGDCEIGGDSLTLIAGPCSIESEEQLCTIAMDVKKSGANILRGGAFKPRTSPYSFQGMGAEGIELLIKAKKASGLPVITELMDINKLDLFNEVDIIQVGARNMQNFELLKQLGKSQKPVLLKRGMSATYEELIMSAEYIMSAGNENIILCERGIRTFEKYTRNTLDLASVPVLKKLTHLPVIVDPSHATGKASLVAPMSLAATAAGADGIMIEVHNDPPHAKCDGPQSLRPEEFEVLARKISQIKSAL